MIIAAFVVSLLALCASAVSVIYTRSQAKHAGVVAGIERERSRVERTPDLRVKPSNERHDDPNEHETAIELTNGAEFALHSIDVAAITDRPGKTAILAVSTESGRAQRVRLPIAELRAGQTTSFDVWLMHAGARDATGVLQFTVRDAQGDEWVIEREIAFPPSPNAYVLGAVW